ncbi:MAG: trypsin-like peptidase domain-containing protein [Candidatus Beckwithbacteria bacterium]
MKKWLTILAVGIIVVVAFIVGFSLNRQTKVTEIRREVLKEESTVINVVDEVSPAVVTVGVKKTEQLIEQDIGSGFVISATEGLVITNRHVVADLDAEYKIITFDNIELAAEKIYRDPINDMAIIKVTPPVNGLKTVKLGDSNNLKAGQTVIAIGTALGEFRSTVTTGVISGLGRGIDAGSPYAGMTERLDNVIQTDAAINPGSSGGPLLNSSGEVIGVNVAVSQAGQNISFAIPINLVKDAINNFNATGKFSRPYLGVRYQMLSERTAVLNKVPQGAYIVETVVNSPAAKAGVRPGDIIEQIDSTKLTELTGLAEVVNLKKVGEEIKLRIYREGKEIIVKMVLEEL